jgi:NADPH:quinone reductase-like Zn-dependent oxidoreductase
VLPSGPIDLRSAGAFGWVTLTAYDLGMDQLRADGREVSPLTYNSNLLRQSHPKRLADSARTALGYIADGKVRSDITAEFELGDLAVAIHRLAGGGTLGKSVLDVAG